MKKAKIKLIGHDKWNRPLYKGTFYGQTKQGKELKLVVEYRLPQ